jgi:hypothetical protein
LDWKYNEWKKKGLHKKRLTRVCKSCHLLEKAYLSGHYTLIMDCDYLEHRFVPLAECGIDGHDHVYSLMEKYYY